MNVIGMAVNSVEGLCAKIACILNLFFNELTLLETQLACTLSHLKQGISFLASIWFLPTTFVIYPPSGITR